MSFISDVGRVGMGIATGGLSEVARAGYNAAKPDPVNAPAALRDGSTDLGAGATKPNPAYADWSTRMAGLQVALGQAKLFGDQAKAQSIQQQIDQLVANKPPPTVNTTLGTMVDRLDTAGAQAQQTFTQQTEALQQTGAQAQQQGNQVNAQAQQQAAAAAGRVAPQMAPEAAATTAAQQQAIGDLNRFAPATQGVQDLRNFANQPTGPSASEAMLRLQAAKDRAAQLSLARSARGGPGAVAEAMKTAQAEAAGISSDTRGQMALLQADEAAKNRANALTALTSAASQEGINQQQVLDARKAVVDATSRVRDQDITVLRENLGAQVQTLGLNDNQVRFFTGLGEAARQQGIEAMMQAQSNGLDATTAAAQVQAQFSQLAWSMLSADQQVELQRIGIEMGIDMSNAQARQQFTGQVLGFLGTGVTAGAAMGGKPPGAAVSDRRAKVDLKKARSMADALRRTPGYTGRYRDEKHGKGKHWWPTAQDLEATPEFRQAVRDEGGLKVVDGAKLALAQHVALHDLQRQIDRLKSAREKR